MPLFASLSDEDRARIADAMEPVTVEAGETLCLQGEFAYQFFVIEAGTAEVITDGVRVAELSAGDCFGEIGLLVTGRRVASVVARSPMRLVVARSPMRLFVLFEQRFRRLARDVPDLTERIRDVLRDRPWLPVAPAMRSGDPS